MSSDLTRVTSTKVPGNVFVYNFVYDFLAEEGQKFGSQKSAHDFFGGKEAVDGVDHR